MVGSFITLEGGEGVGKSTQLAALADALRARGHDVVTTREPGGTAGAEDIRALLMRGDDDKWSPRAEALLFAAARADHVDRIIRPAIGRGAWVVCDRFVDSSRAYQGGHGELGDADILALHAIGSDGLLPDRTLVLALPLVEAEARAATRDGGKSDRFGARNSAYHEQVRRRFEDFARDEPTRVRLVNASGDAATVTARLMVQLEDLL